MRKRNLHLLILLPAFLLSSCDRHSPPPTSNPVAATLKEHPYWSKFSESERINEETEQRNIISQRCFELSSEKFYHRDDGNPDARPQAVAREVYRSLHKNPQWDGLVAICAFGGCTAQGDAYLRVEFVCTKRDVTAIVLRPDHAVASNASSIIRYTRAQNVKDQLMETAVSFEGTFFTPEPKSKPGSTPQTPQPIAFEFDSDDPNLLIPDFHIGPWEVACERENGEQSNFIPVNLQDLAPCPPSTIP